MMLHKSLAKYPVAVLTSLVIGLSASVASAEMGGKAITTYEDAVAASSLAEKWVNGELPLSDEVTYQGPPITYRYSTYLPAVSGLEKINTQALQQLERESKGKIKVESFYSQSLHPQAEGFTAVRDGIADFAACFMIYEPTSFKMLHGLTLPFQFDDSTAATRTATALYPKYFKGEYENMGVYLGREFIATPYNIIGNASYRQLADFKGSKIRAGGRTQSAVLKALGAVAVNVPSAEMYTSLQRGLVDSVALNDPAIPVFKLNEVSKYHSQVGLFAVNVEYCISPDWFDALPADLKRIYYNWQQKTNYVLAQVFYEREARRVQDTFRKSGIELVVPAAAEIAKWKAIVAPVTDEWIADTEKAGLPAKALLAELATIKAKSEAMSWNEQFQEAIDKPVKGLINF